MQRWLSSLLWTRVSVYLLAKLVSDSKQDLLVSWAFTTFLTQMQTPLYGVSVVTGWLWTIFFKEWRGGIQFDKLTYKHRWGNTQPPIANYASDKIYDYTNRTLWFFGLREASSCGHVRCFLEVASDKCPSIFCGLFNDPASTQKYIAPNNTAINERQIKNDFE